MTITSSLRSKIDSLWLEFHSGGITNPITVIEQISYLMFARLLDLTESRNEKRASRLKQDFKPIFPKSKQHLRWSHFKQQGGDDMLKTVRDELFPFLRSEIQQHSALGKFLKAANCLIPSGNLLVRAVNAIEALPLDPGANRRPEKLMLSPVELPCPTSDPRSRAEIVAGDPHSIRLASCVNSPQIKNQQSTILNLPSASFARPPRLRVSNSFVSSHHRLITAPAFTPE